MNSIGELLASCAGGIIMSAESVRATRDGRKTQTRRVLSHLDADNCSFFACEKDMDGKPQPSDAVFRWNEKGHSGPGMYVSCGEYPEEGSVILHARYQPGKRYYVREAIRLTQSERPDYDRAEYESDGAVTKLDTWPWKRYRLSAMIMPRGIARYVIEVESVRVHRLHDITEEDARAEGMEWKEPCFNFQSAWDAINGRKFPWASNPWVWAISYHLVQP